MISAACEDQASVYPHVLSHSAVTCCDCGSKGSYFCCALHPGPWLLLDFGSCWQGSGSCWEIWLAMQSLLLLGSHSWYAAGASSKQGDFQERKSNVSVKDSSEPCCLDTCLLPIDASGSKPTLHGAAMQGNVF